jgi:type II secretory pathway component PulJ
MIVSNKQGQLARERPQGAEMLVLSWVNGRSKLAKVKRLAAIEYRVSENVLCVARGLQNVTVKTNSKQLKH